MNNETPDNAGGRSSGEQDSYTLHPMPETASEKLSRFLEVTSGQNLGQLSINRRRPGGKFASKVVQSIDEAAGLVQEFTRDSCVWVGINPLRDGVGERKRGQADDVAALVALPVDFDVKEGQCRDLAHAQEIIDALTRLLGFAPVLVASGHGLQPRWMLEPLAITGEESRHEAQDILKRWADFVRSIARGHGCESVDSVFALARVFRAPSTSNFKDPVDPKPVTLLSLGSVGQLPLARILEVLDAYTPATVSDGASGIEAAPTAETVPSPVSWGYEVCSRCRAYGISALKKELAKLAPMSKPGDGRNEQYFASFKAVAELVAGGALPQSALDYLTQAARATNLPESEIRSVTSSASKQIEARDIERVHREQGHPDAVKPKPLPPWHPPRNLQQVDEVVTRWMGEHIDLELVHCVLAAAACEQLEGDPPWLLLVGASGGGKTELLMPLEGIGAQIISSMTSEAALLSGSAAKDRAAEATGGVLHEMGESGHLVLKDFTSILEMGKDGMAALLAALREVYDGAYIRAVGTDGGKKLEWKGRGILIGGVTTAYDAKQAAIAKMGDRFLLVRLNSDDATHQASATQAGLNFGQEKRMRTELKDAYTGLLANLPIRDMEVPQEVRQRLQEIATFVAKMRTGVEKDEGRKVLWAHDTEAPTRLTKQLMGMYQGARAIGLNMDEALKLAVRVAVDTCPPLRTRTLIALLKHDEPVTASNLSKASDIPSTGAYRATDELAALGLITARDGDSQWVNGKPVRLFSPKRNIAPEVLAALLSRNSGSPMHPTEEASTEAAPSREGVSSRKTGEGERPEPEPVQASLEIRGAALTVDSPCRTCAALEGIDSTGLSDKCRPLAPLCQGGGTTPA